MRSTATTCCGLLWLAITPWLAAGCDGAPEQVAAPSELTLWVWRRDEDLSFIDPDSVGLALWVATIRADQHGVDVAARENPVVYPAGTRVRAVVRLEIEPGAETAALKVVADAIAGIIEPLDTRALQIDFDARVSQREFYRTLIDRVRERLPRVSLSITALASWCFGDPWITDLPVDAAVPMYFRMGADGGQISHYLSSARQIPATICRENAGYSLDEPDVPAVPVHRVYVFSPEPWNEDQLDRATELFVR